jgi:sialidase-1
LQDGTIGAYIEEGEPGMNLVFLNFSLEWLTRKHK